MADSSAYSFSSPTGQTTRVPSLVEEYDENKSKVDVEARNEQDTVDDSREINEKLPTPTESSSSHSKVNAVDPPPDGGLRAWLVVLGATCAGFCTFGFANAFGVFQAYYTRTIPGATQFSIAWIGSLQYCLIFLPGLLAGHIADIGYLRHMLAIAAIVLITSIFLVPECTTLWQLILCQGIAVGGASGFLFMPSVGVVSQYFLKRRSTAFGCTALGSSLGGTILPIALRKLMTAVGFKWTIRILGFIIATLLGVMVLCVRPRTVARKHGGWPPVLELLRNPALRYYAIGVSMMWLGIYNPLTYFDVYAQEQLHIPSSKSFYVIVTANAASLIGRLGSGIVADRLGALTVLTACCASAALITILWPYTTSFATLEVVAVLYGICSGAFVSLLPAPSSHMVEPHQMGTTIGLTSTCMAFGALVSSPIAGQILDTAGGLNFAAVGGYSGGIALFACLFCVAARYHALKGWKGKF